MSAGDFTRKMSLDHELDCFLITGESNEEAPIKLHFSFATFHPPIAFVSIPSPADCPAVLSPAPLTVSGSDRLTVLAGADQLEVLTGDDR
jgi:hypothetical protein